MAGLAAPSYAAATMDADGTKLKEEREKFKKAGGAAAPQFALRNAVGEDTTAVVPSVF